MSHSRQRTRLTSHLVNLRKVFVILGSRLVLCDNIFEVIFLCITEMQMLDVTRLLTDFREAISSFLDRLLLRPLLVGYSFICR